MLTLYRDGPLGALSRYKVPYDPEKLSLEANRGWIWMNPRGGLRVFDKRPSFRGFMLMNSRGWPPQFEKDGGTSRDNFYGSFGMYFINFYCVDISRHTKELILYPASRKLYYLFTLFTKHQKSIISRVLCRNFVDSVKKVLGGKLIDYLT